MQARKSTRGSRTYRPIAKRSAPQHGACCSLPCWRRSSSSDPEVSSISTRLSSATHSRRSSRRSASRIATRCGCSGRQRACTGGAAGRYFSLRGRSGRKAAQFRAGCSWNSAPTASSSAEAHFEASRTGSSCGAASSRPPSRSRSSGDGSSSAPFPIDSTSTARSSSAFPPRHSRLTRGSAS